MAAKTRRVEQVLPLRAVGYAVLAVWVIAPLAVGFGLITAWLTRPDDKFPVAFGTTAAFGLITGLLVASPLRRRAARDRGAHGPTGL